MLKCAPCGPVMCMAGLLEEEKKANKQQAEESAKQNQVLQSKWSWVYLSM